MAGLTATYNTTDRILRVEGTDAADTITVQNNAGQLSVKGISIKVYNARVGSTVASRSRSEVTRVEVRSLSGNDLVEVHETSLASGQAAPMIVWAGDGDDRITGGGAGDRLMGENGRDIIRGLAGNDSLFGAFGTSDVEAVGTNGQHAELGSDQLYGGARRC